MRPNSAVTEPVVVDHWKYVEVEPLWRPSRALVPLGRALFSLLFIMSAPGHFTSQTVGYAAQAGVPMAGILVPLTGVMLLLGGVSVLLGLRARVGAWLIVAFLVPVTLMMHNFWSIADPAMRGMQQGHFFKNVALTGAALLIAYFGAGPFSVDRLRLRWRLQHRPVEVAL
jgi:putative oxidoreductase